ncbi:hypothetical protein P153DRAFT_344937 [Dothidotthia symphoricarpi CBS 119687]|uniref:BTB domain-containing protein n=1 Tax=Dothidotthia symphoricarpi CBS 119687 TaxID=1392245 RepID=A0A6A6A690_9PLEO|nr:uncharacterized protein P153DRAFT_344937 [Dothidotthia symphoricarpi CBS 119687]KAF2127350.1 hypothetical protein P153DRAFT_344937 [Dothidotthia symphoricarpi CBS 119687]
MAHSDHKEPVTEPPAFGTIVSKGCVVIEVGPHHRKYDVHKGLLVYHSEYFRNSLRGSWKEAREGKIVLEDVDPHVFNTFVYWLYTHTLAPDYKDQDFGHDLEKSSRHFVVSIQAYAFGDRFLVPAFRRAVNNDLVTFIKELYVEIEDMVAMAQEAFATIPSDRPILQLLVDDHCDYWYQRHEGDAALLDKLPQAFLVRVMRRFAEQKGNSKKVKRCYYEHGSEEEANDCPHEHMVFDEELQCGFFGEQTTD